MNQAEQDVLNERAKQRAKWGDEHDEKLFWINAIGTKIAILLGFGIAFLFSRGCS